MITRKSDGIKIEGHCGTWYVIDEGDFALTPDTEQGPQTFHERCFLLEHEEYGDEAPCLIVNQDGKLIADDVYNGFEDIEEAGWERTSPVGMNYQEWCRLDENDARKINYTLCGFWGGERQTVKLTSEDEVDGFMMARVQMSTIKSIRLENDEWFVVLEY